MMIRGLLALGSLTAVLLAACSGGTTCTGEGCPSEGTESSSGSPSNPTNPSLPGSAPDGGGADAGGSDKTCYGTASSCWCGDFTGWEGSGDTKVSSCSRSSGATYCCQTNDFPSGGSCICNDTPPNCAESEFGDTCTCSLAAPSQGDKPVDSCTAKAGGICCIEPSVIAPMCSCFDDLTSCPDGGTPVSSCSVGQLQCSDKTVTECSY